MYAALNPNNNPEPHNLGSMSKTCTNCDAKFFTAETSGSVCCRKGKVHLPPFLEQPEFLKHLLRDITPQSNLFRKNIRQYNTAHAFASFGASVQELAGTGPYVFKVHGTVYHNQSALEVSEGSRRAFAQLYIIDDDAANEERMAFPGRQVCNPDIMHQIGQFISTNNPFARVYRQMHELHTAQQQLAAANGQQQPDVQIRLFQPQGNQHAGVYNIPVANQVAVAFESVDGNVPTSRDIIVHSRFGPNQQIPATSPHIDAMLYPIFFPRGDSGWTYGIPYIIPGQNARRDNALDQDDPMGDNLEESEAAQGRTTIAIREFYAFRLAIRQDEYNPILLGGRLFQQFLVDIFCRIEANRLSFVRSRQNQLRQELYTGLMDYVQGDGDVCIVLDILFFSLLL
jgi:Helitron helicase-like domain at N-terminus